MILKKIEELTAAIAAARPAVAATKPAVKPKAEWWTGTAIVLYDLAEKQPGNFLDCDKKDGNYCEARVAWVAVKNELVDSRLYPAFPTSTNLYSQYKIAALLRAQSLGYKLGPLQFEAEMEKHLTNVRGSKKIQPFKARLLALHDKERDAFQQAKAPKIFRPARLGEVLVAAGPPSLSPSSSSSSSCSSSSSSSGAYQVSSAVVTPSRSKRAVSPHLQDARKSSSDKKVKLESPMSLAQSAVEVARSWTGNVDFLRIAAARGQIFGVLWDGSVLGSVKLLATSGKLPNRMLHGYIRCEKSTKWKKATVQRKAFEDDEVIPSDKKEGLKTVAQFLGYVGTVDVWWELLQLHSIFDSPKSDCEVEGDDEELLEDTS